jgi:hypothetical protein
MLNKEISIVRGDISKDTGISGAKYYQPVIHHDSLEKYNQLRVNEPRFAI